MRNTDLYRVKQGIDKCSDIVNVADINFAYTLAKIESEVISELRIIEKSRKAPSAEYKEYTTERDQLMIDSGIQNPEGGYHVLDGKLLLRNPKEYAVKMNALDEKYKVEIETFKKNSEEFESFLLQECKATITKLPKGCIPAQLNVEQMRLLFSVIE